MAVLLEKEGETGHQKKNKKNIFSTLEILRQRAKTFKMRLENTLNHTKHCLTCNLRPLETSATTGPVHVEVITYTLNFFASIYLTCIFKILH